MKKVTRATASADPMFSSYAALATSLIENFSGLCLLDADFEPRGNSSTLNPAQIRQWLDTLGWDGPTDRSPAAMTQGGKCLVAIPVEQTDGTLLGAFCVQQMLAAPPTQPSRHAAEVQRKLKPLLDCVHREFAAALPIRSRVQALTERTAELEWLFQVTGRLKGSSDERRLVEELLNAATERLQCALGVLFVPDKRLTIEHETDMLAAVPLREVWLKIQQQLIVWAQRQQRPLVVNRAGKDGVKLARCKILSVPIVRETGRVLGVMAFFNPADSPDFESRHVFLARHLGRETAALVDAQFDLMTGLYTRGGIEQMYGSLADDPTAPDRTIIYLDVDHMHVVNELHGFELGNELIVRIADLMAPPLLPAGAMAARVSGDRFAIIVPESDPREAGKIAEKIQAAAARLVIGPPLNTVEVSVSCGVASLVIMPQGLARAMAAAELACKTAKNRGRNRVELYACEDNSMMRSHDDAVAVGKLRSALKTDRLLLYAQRITPLQNRSLPGGYELLLRLRDEDGSLVAPGPLIAAAQRYQLLPTVDRWVVKHALKTLSAYRGMLKTRGISISINVSGQSIGDEDFIEYFKQQIAGVNLPSDCIWVEITEQAAVHNLARANDMIARLKVLGCRFALDDFGTGTNSLTSLKSLAIGRLKIDGSFVRDILTDRNSQATVHAIVQLAKSLSMDTVAEYVETEEIAQAVRKLGVDYAQGYAYGKPEPLDGLLESLGQDESRRLHKLFLEM